jgi:hypothetical protein
VNDIIKYEIANAGTMPKPNFLHWRWHWHRFLETGFQQAAITCSYLPFDILPIGPQILM